ncbi:Protein of unknown function DUF504 [Methanocaldococcus vulcanius M7]|uniref:UPF0248 protein Metvu_1199 n=1 Tax=Methanocaldococcus vulcanius (strain ATCC 700851 / DSM 12094 / M7) TaxID=579137 RepID=C9RHK5_METVM|nr:DUF504 domain-containing protein [Methanocaldococcus vulcanius]ACX73057.1 Protein of unknown function DUF504 [Methanocaldococcus vulcanius M7]
MTLKDILNKILWHPKYKKEEFELVILHRGAKNNKKVIPLENVDIKGSYIVYEDTYIPLHRILMIRKKGRGDVIYSKHEL